MNMDGDTSGFKAYINKDDCFADETNLSISPIKIQIENLKMSLLLTLSVIFFIKI